MRPRSYLDHNATSPLRTGARAAMVAAFDCVGNPSSIHAEGRAARQIVEDARETVAAIFAVEPSRVYFTSSGTEAANWLLQPRRDETLAVSAVEHPCVLSGHRFEPGKLREVPVLEDGAIDLNALEAALSPGSAAAVQAANNETGVVQRTAEIAEIVHSKGAVLICDAVQAIGRLPLRELEGADVLFFSAHKFGGPKSAGAAIVRDPDFLPAPLLKGGGQERRQRSGTENVPGIAGLAAALEVAVAEQAGFAARAEALRDKLECGIRAIAPDAVIFGAPPGATRRHSVTGAGEDSAASSPRRRGPISQLVPASEMDSRLRGNDAAADADRLPNTTCFAVPGKSAGVSLIAFDLGGVAVSSGSACSSGKVERSHVLAAMGISPELSGGAIRVSTGWTTTEADIERFLTVLSRICDGRVTRHGTCSHPQAGHAV
jgi:cysteine desulfurase